MKAASLLIITLFFASPWVKAESIATGGLLDPVVRNFTICSACKNMDNLRNIFLQAHDKSKPKDVLVTAKKAVSEVTAHAKRLTAIAEKDSIQLRNAHYANEITAFYYLAAEALPYAEDMQIAYAIAYLNRTLGSQDIFSKVLSDETLNRPENSCRKTFFKKAVETQECEVAKELEEENAIENKTTKNKKAVAKAKGCEELKFNVPSCEAEKAARARIK